MKKTVLALLLVGCAGFASAGTQEQGAEVDRYMKSLEAISVPAANAVRLLEAARGEKFASVDEARAVIDTDAFSKAYFIELTVFCGKPENATQPSCQ